MIEKGKEVNERYGITDKVRTANRTKKIFALYDLKFRSADHSPHVFSHPYDIKCTFSMEVLWLRSCFQRALTR